VGGVRIGAVFETYAGVAPATPVAVVGSAGLLEIAVRNGHAAYVLALGPGTPITLTPA
jgi:S-adenosylmethionine hydrolase